MPWDGPSAKQLRWVGEISNRAEKEAVAARLIEQLRDGDVIGVGSGSTSYLALQALVDSAKQLGIAFRAIPTSYEANLACTVLGVPTTSLLDEAPSWCFDGADEVDAAGDMIKGRGGALLREKLVMASTTRRFVLVDRSKVVDQLGTNFSIPVEVIPESLHLVEHELARLDGVADVALRMATGKDGPIITENANLLLDVRAPKATRQLAAAIVQVPGVVETGFFSGFEPDVLVP